VENSCFFFLNYKKLDSYTSIRSISGSAYVIKAERELLTNFKWNLKNVKPNDGNVADRNAKSMEFFFLKIVEIETASKVQSFFPKWDA
jgi:hypothetical protein